MTANFVDFAFLAWTNGEHLREVREMLLAPRGHAHVMAYAQPTYRPRPGRDLRPARVTHDVAVEPDGLGLTHKREREEPGVIRQG